MARAASIQIGGTGSQGRWLTRAGWLLSVLPAGLLLFSGAMKLMRPPEMVKAFTGQFGFPEGALLGIALAEIGSALLYAFPPTAVLGAVLVTGYMGGAVATHVRVGDPFVVQLGVGVVAWAGIWLREARLRALLPLRLKG
jgi:hypothetical protein